MNQAERVYCPACKRWVIPEYELDIEGIRDLGWGCDYETARKIPICPNCGLELTQNVVDSFRTNGG